MFQTVLSMSDDDSGLGMSKVKEMKLLPLHGTCACAPLRSKIRLITKKK